MSRIFTPESIKNTSARAIQVRNMIRLVTDVDIKQIHTREECKYFDSSLYILCMYTSLLERGYNKDGALSELHSNNIDTLGLEGLTDLPSKALGDGLHDYLMTKYIPAPRNKVLNDINQILVEATCYGFSFKELNP